MASSTTQTSRVEPGAGRWTATDRIRSLKAEVEGAVPGICPERALLWTECARDKHHRKKRAAVQAAEALDHVLGRKTIRIHPDELLAGNFTSRRVGGMIQPELAGITALLEIHAFPGRRENPLEISRRDMARLAAIVPFWLAHGLAWKACPSVARRPGFLLRNAWPKDWVINELGGIAHLAPDHQRLLARGTDGIKAEVLATRKRHPPGSRSWTFLSALATAAEALARFGERYAHLAARMAVQERDPDRRAELAAMSRACHQVPRHPARTFHEALQSVLLAHIAVVHEGLDVSICPGRLDRILHPFYEKDLAEGRLTRDQAGELFACFCIKLCETVPVFARMINRLFSGLPSYQTVCVGGTDSRGEDAVNDLSFLMLEVVDVLRMREPNFHARIHAKSPPAWLDRVFSMLADGANTPALYNDDVIVPTLVKYGVAEEDARNYTPIGCVEPAVQGKAFASTDAALVNVPAALERAMNQGRRFGERRRTGARTLPVHRMRSTEDLWAAFSAQLDHQLTRLIRDLTVAEKANARFHPTPLTSLLIDGCIHKARDVTQGGAVYNFSGVQCVGPADVGDSFAAVDRAVFREKHLTLDGLKQALELNLPDEATRSRLARGGHFGNDDPEADRWTVRVVREFVRLLESHGTSTRGGRYVTGLYSTTTHEHFGRVTGALPNGRRRGEPFASGIAPVNGMDTKGPTAVINSMNRIDYTACPNGINFNIRFATNALAGPRGAAILRSLFGPWFDRGGMQAQINVVDARTLEQARANPGLYPNLMVRVSGYSAYFNDLTDPVKDEIIRRSAHVARPG